MTIWPAMATSASHECAEAHVGERAQAPAREGHRGQAEQQDEADEHLAQWDRPAGGRLEGTARRSSNVRGWLITNG